MNASDSHGVDRPIAVGDLVQIVRVKRCGCTRGLGVTFRVESIEPSPGGGRCSECKADTYPPKTLQTHVRNGHYAELRRLKRIPPLSDLVGERTEEQLKEPV